MAGRRERGEEEEREEEEGISRALIMVCCQLVVAPIPVVDAGPRTPSSERMIK